MISARKIYHRFFNDKKMAPKINQSIIDLTVVVGLVLGAVLGGEGEGELLAAGLSQDNLLLVDSVGGVLELGNVEALLLNLVLALDLGDLNGLGDADLVGGGVGQGAGLLLGLSDQGHSVGLGLVLLSAVLVLAMTVAGRTVSGWAAGCYLKVNI